MAAVTDHLSNPKPSSEAYQRASGSADFIRSKLPSHLQNPRVAIVCGSGLGGIADTVTSDTKLEIDYHDIPNFPKTTVQGHAGKLVVGTMGETKVPVVLLVGRAHFYEGHTMELVTFATRVCKVLGIETMIVTNAAGGLNPDYNVGDIVCLNDHLNMAGLVGFHPLRGPNADDFGVRFPPLSDAYDLGLRQKAHQTWQKVRPSDGKRKLHEGVYAFVAGPTYETRAECRMLHQLGADVVGMSTVPEIIVARHSGIRILAFSLVTNKAVLQSVPRGDDAALSSMSPQELIDHLGQGKANHEEVIEAGREAAKDMQVRMTDDGGDDVV
ncbi:purine nucleoside phosphorylase-like protein [Aureobasidium pullulans]|uniref:Purine nucleoside phosphorylase n=1 Tax=Aureobasidium pullulans TaxID=5580 RepID=A0A4S9TV56_AURPU|nr:purine nucleoside phosphorylase-like protein [Aureobasidium pullulans]THW13458.1 purine nucleoside phosphorylase-like protein [Aureobasidium pullulans]THW25359.1 purine nucleoside phosphorylase-like protein [Aureobasidium pullulans]THW32234.1 purine nucleoside phosphorylase-like protein [Aureobasidium pullulans]THW55625.1 purine nucleoside phosphorylase-like protein [Aureobasidium pullulans]